MCNIIAFLLQEKQREALRMDRLCIFKKSTTQQREEHSHIMITTKFSQYNNKFEKRGEISPSEIAKRERVELYYTRARRDRQAKATRQTISAPRQLLKIITTLHCKRQCTYTELRVGVCTHSRCIIAELLN